MQQRVRDVWTEFNAPLEDRLFFAGEQFCVPFYGYMEGVLQSGARAAVNIMTMVCPRPWGRSALTGHNDRLFMVCKGSGSFTARR
jgi:hypothetical protein